MSKFLLISNEIDVNTFDCGNDELNTFLKQKALLNQERMLGGTTLMVDDEKSSNFIIGYYTLSPCHVAKETLPRNSEAIFPKKFQLLNWRV